MSYDVRVNKLEKPRKDAETIRFEVYASGNFSAEGKLGPVPDWSRVPLADAIALLVKHPTLTSVEIMGE